MAGINDRTVLPKYSLSPPPPQCWSLASNLSPALNCYAVKNSCWNRVKVSSAEFLGSDWIRLDQIGSDCPRGLTFTWWGCYGLRLGHKPAELARSFFSFFFFSLLFLCLFLSLWPFQLYSINHLNNSPFACSVPPVLFLPYWSFWLFIFLWKSPSALI